jgi:hypothetical protein
MKSKILQWLALVLILETGLLHFVTAQAEFEEAAYLGYLFMANFLAALVAAYGIYRFKAWGWALGAFIAAGSMAGYIWSRTLGMPGMEVEAWVTPYGLVALGVEGLFLLLCGFRPWRVFTSAEPQPNFPLLLRDLAPTLGLLVIVSLSFGAYRWDARVSADVHNHGTVAELCSTPLTSLADLEQRYGVSLSLVAVTALDSFVDVRFRVLDAQKARALFANHAALLVEQKELILAPHMHNHDKLKSGGTYLIFFPTQRLIRPGTQVSLVFGRMRVEPVTVK